MRVLVLSDLYPPVAFGGYELDCESFVEGLRSHHDVLVLTSVLDRGSAPEQPHVRRELPWAGGGRMRETLLAGAKALRAARVTRRVIDEFRPDLVYVSNCVSVPQAAPAVAKALGLPLVYRLSETFFATELYWGDRFLRHLRPGDRGPRALWGFAMRLLNRMPALRLDPSASSRAAVSWASKDLSERTTLPVGTEAVLERVIYPASGQSERFARTERRPGPAPIVLYLGRVTLNKGAELALRAVVRARETHPEARLVVVGYADSETEQRLEAVATGLGAADALDLRGRIPEEELAGLLASAHALVVPSLVPDVFPLVCIEGALAGVPIVASRIGGIPEALEDGEEALLVEPGDEAELASAIAQTLSNPEGAGRRAARARERMSRLTPERYRAESEAFVSEAFEALRAPNGR